MIALLDLTAEELKKELERIGEKPYRAAQVKKWLNIGVPFEDMTNLSAVLREKLRASYVEGYLVTLDVQQAEDGTKKYLFELRDGNTVESVYMPKRYGTSLCVSTQVGCRMGCAFCASGEGGLVRNLTAGEMLAQVIAANADNGQKVDHIVLMGMGEPLDNFENTVKFIGLVNSEDGLNIGQRNLSLSTCGIPEKMAELAEHVSGVTLSVSLHAPTQAQREKVMPIAKKYMIGEVLAAANQYFEKTGRRIIIEYSLIEGFNDSGADAEALAGLLRGMNCHVNLIALNARGAYGAPPQNRVYAFCAELEKLGVSATVRKSMGSEIEGACGQLKQRHAGGRE